MVILKSTNGQGKEFVLGRGLSLAEACCLAKNYKKLNEVNYFAIMDGYGNSAILTKEEVFLDTIKGLLFRISDSFKN